MKPAVYNPRDWGTRPTHALNPPAALAGIYAGSAAALVPFYPVHWAPALAALTAVLTFFRPRTGVAVALAVPVLPLGNVSVALAVLYGFVASAWFLLNLREPERATFAALGPLLGPLGALAVLPLLLRNGRSGPLHNGRVRPEALALVHPVH